MAVSHGPIIIDFILFLFFHFVIPSASSLDQILFSLGESKQFEGGSHQPGETSEPRSLSGPGHIYIEESFVEKTFYIPRECRCELYQAVKLARALVL